MATDTSKGVSHLEHLEDFLFVHGKTGVETGLATVRRFIKSLEDASDDVVVSEKLDGSPSVFFGKAPDGRFFLSTKSLMNAEQKIAYSLADIQRQWNGELSQILSSLFVNLKPAFKSQYTAVQADVLFPNKGKKVQMDVEGQPYLTFQPNTITYGIPVDKKSDLYQNVRQASVGLVVHGVYETSFGNDQRIELDQKEHALAKEEAAVLMRDRNVFAIDPFVPNLKNLNSASDILNELKDLTHAVETALDEVDPEFNEMWEENSDPMIRKIKQIIPQFVNQQVRLSGDEETIITATDEKQFIKMFRKKLSDYINKQRDSEQAALRTSAGRDRKFQRYEELKGWMNEMDQTIEPFLKVYFRLFSIKNLLVKLFDQVERKLGKTFMVDRTNEFSIKAVKPEGYVLLNGPNMVKIVDRAEFSRNNMLYSPFKEEKEVSTPMPRSERLSDSVVEDVFDTLEAMRSVYNNFNDEKLVEEAEKFKRYSLVLVGRFQPPTIAHATTISRLAKIFKNVNVFLSKSDNKTPKYLKANPLSVEDRKEVLESDPRLRDLKNVRYAGGSTIVAFGSNDPDKEQTVRDMFGLNSGEPLVIGLGKEDDRYYKMRDMGVFFNLNEKERPSEKKRIGLYGIDLQKGSEDAGKISSSKIRQAIEERDLELAKKIMAGSDDVKDETIKCIAEKEAYQRPVKEQTLSDEMQFKIEEFDIDEEIVSDTGKELGVTQEEALDMLLDILEAK